MEKTIVTSFMIIAGVISAVFFFNTIYPAVIRSGDAITSVERRLDERLRSHVEIIHATGNNSNQAFVWVKNVGSSTIKPIERCDVFFGPEDNFSRIPHGASVGNPSWEWRIENGDGSNWTPATTLRITVTYGSAVLSGRYFVKVVTPNGVSDEYYFSE